MRGAEAGRHAQRRGRERRQRRRQHAAPLLFRLARAETANHVAQHPSLHTSQGVQLLCTCTLCRQVNMQFGSSRDTHWQWLKWQLAVQIRAELATEHRSGTDAR